MGQEKRDKNDIPPGKQGNKEPPIKVSRAFKWIVLIIAIIDLVCLGALVKMYLIDGHDLGVLDKCAFSKFCMEMCKITTTVLIGMILGKAT